MSIKFDECDLNNDFYHFTNKKNIESILKEGLKPQIGTASKLVEDRPNVSVSQGGKGIMGIINSFIYKFSDELKISEIPAEFKQYFLEISDFDSNETIGDEKACKAMIRKLKDEVYLKVNVDEKQLEEAEIGGLTGYDVNLPSEISKDNIDVITDNDNNILTAYDVAIRLYEKTKDMDVFKQMNEGFFKMCEIDEQNRFVESIVKDSIKGVSDLTLLDKIDEQERKHLYEKEQSKNTDENIH